MSQTLSLSVQMTHESSFDDVVRIMTEGAWEVRDVEGVSYLPPEAEDVADWKLFSADSAEHALEVCARRILSGQVAGIVLLLKGSNSGGSFVWADGTLLVSLSVNVTDRWDLNRWAHAIARPLDENGLVESFALSYS